MAVTPRPVCAERFDAAPTPFSVGEKVSPKATDEGRQPDYSRPAVRAVRHPVARVSAFPFS